MAPEAIHDPAEMMQQEPVEIAESFKREVSTSAQEEIPESKRSRVLGGLPVNVSPLRICVPDLDEYSGSPATELDLTDIRGTLSGELLPPEKVQEGRAR